MRLRALVASGTLVVLGGCAAIAIVAAGGCSGHPAQHQAAHRSRGHKHATLTGSIKLSNHTWRCRSAVDLSLVRVLLNGSGKDGVHFGKGCTGTIDYLEVLGARNDGVKVGSGAHDLRILSGQIDCSGHAKGVHQDAIQAMGGIDIQFDRISSTGCANSFMFINTGRRSRQPPTNVICRDCTAESANYSVSIRHSVRSGIIGGSFTSSRPPHATSTATQPILQNPTWHRVTASNAG